MKIGLFRSLAALLAGASVALAQQPAASTSTLPGGASPSAAPGQVQSTSITPGSLGRESITCANGVCVNGGCNSFADCFAVDNTRLWFNTEYLFWDFKDGGYPPIGSRVSTQLPVPLQNQTLIIQTQVFLPTGINIVSEERSGVRFSGGYWLDDAKDLGIEGSFFWTNPRTDGATADTLNTLPVNIGVSNGDQIFATYLARINVAATDKTDLYGLELNLRTRALYLGAWSFDFLLGSRHLNFEEDLLIRNNTALIPTAPVTINNFPVTLPTLAFTTVDSIQTRNQYYGAQVGTTAEWNCYGLYLRATAKIGVGAMHQSATLLGFTQTSFGPIAGTTIIPFGDIGTHNRNRISVVPEAIINLGYQWTPNIRTYLGYNFLYMTNLLRAGDQIGFAVINPQIGVVQQTGARAPLPATIPVTPFQTAQFTYRERDVWFQGISFGAEVRF